MEQFFCFDILITNHIICIDKSHFQFISIIKGGGVLCLLGTLMFDPKILIPKLMLMCVCVWLGHSLILSLVLLDTGGGEYRAGQGQQQQQHHRGAHHQAAHHTSSSTLNSIHKVSNIQTFFFFDKIKSVIEKYGLNILIHTKVFGCMYVCSVWPRKRRKWRKQFLEVYYHCTHTIRRGWGGGQNKT